jgi:hypothetical protein
MKCLISGVVLWLCVLATTTNADHPRLHLSTGSPHVATHDVAGPAADLLAITDSDKDDNAVVEHKAAAHTATADPVVSRQPLRAVPSSDQASQIPVALLALVGASLAGWLCYFAATRLWRTTLRRRWSEAVQARRREQSVMMLHVMIQEDETESHAEPHILRMRPIAPTLRPIAELRKAA